MSEKKILFVATVTGHIKAFHTPYLKLFKEMGYEVHVASKGNDEIEYCDKHYDIPFSRLPLKKENIKAYKMLKNIINSNQYEIIHCHTPVGGVLTRLAAKKARKNGTRVIYTAHGFHFYKGAPLKNWLIYYPIEKYLSRYTDTLITITKEDYELAKKKFKKVKNIEYVHGVGLDTSRFDINIEDNDLNLLRKNLGITTDNIVLSYVAELNANKNQMFLFKVIQELIKENKNYVLLLIGKGNKKEEYEEFVKQNGLEEHIKILGKRSDIPQLLKITNIYVASSIREGLPVNIMEAMYMALPIIATDNRGHRELLGDGTGYISNDFTQYVNEIKRISALQNGMKLSNKENAMKYSLKNIMNKMKTIYNIDKNINEIN